LEILMPVTVRTPMRDLVIPGGTGDLAAPKLLPALHRCHRDGQPPDETRIVTAPARVFDDQQDLPAAHKAGDLITLDANAGTLELQIGQAASVFAARSRHEISVS
jgi:glucose-6-phosphate 1-dehydrogenase